MKTLQVPEELWLDLEIAAAWERTKVLDLLRRVSRAFLENRVLPSLNPDKRRRAEVLRSVRARGLSQRQISAKIGTSLEPYIGDFTDSFNSLAGRRQDVEDQPPRTPT